MLCWGALTWCCNDADKHGFSVLKFGLLIPVVGVGGSFFCRAGLVLGGFRLAGDSPWVGAKPPSQSAGPLRVMVLEEGLATGGDWVFPVI